MNLAPRWWKIALFDFVDDFRYHKEPAAIVKPFKPRDEQSDATLAAVI